MRIKDVVEQTKEYNRLQGLIDALTRAIQDLMTPVEDENDGFGKISVNSIEYKIEFSGHYAVGDGSGPKTRFVNVALGDSVVKHIKDNLVVFLEKEVNDLIARQLALEV